MFHLHPDFLVRVTVLCPGLFSPTQGLSVLISPSSPRLWKLCLSSHQHPLVSSPGSDFAPLQPRLGCSSPLHPSVLLSGWQCRALCPAPFPAALLPIVPPLTPWPQQCCSLDQREHSQSLQCYTHLSCLCIPRSFPVSLQIARRSSVSTPTWPSSRMSCPWSWLTSSTSWTRQMMVRGMGREPRGGLLPG